MTVLAEVVDPDGSRVVLDEERWSHILEEHAEIGPYRDELIATIVEPDHHRPDPWPGRERFWRGGLGPSRWLFVVVDFGEDPGRVVTAYGNRKAPPGWTDAQ